MAVAKLAVTGQADPWTENERETMRKLITQSILATAVVLAMASSAWAALIPIGQFQYLEPKFSIINQTGIDSTDDFPVTTALTFVSLHVDLNGGFQLDWPVPADFTENLNSLDSNGDFFIASGTLIPMILTGSVAPGLVNLTSGTVPAWNGSWNILTGILVDALGNPAITMLLDNTSFIGTELIYVEATAVPEPMTVGLFATGLAGLMLRRRNAAKR